MKPHDTVVLRRRLPDVGLEAGDIGAVVHRHGEDAFEVEFVSGEGTTVAVVTLRADDLRPVSAGDMLHVRSLGQDQLSTLADEALAEHRAGRTKALDPDGL